MLRPRHLTIAKPGSTKWLSRRQEERIAKIYGGVVSPSSGASAADPGDVRTDDQLFECKHTGTFDKPAKSISIKLSDLEKIADEAWAEGRDPVMALCIYNPDSVLSDHEGNVDVIVRLKRDDWVRNG